MTRFAPILAVACSVLLAGCNSDADDQGAPVDGPVAPSTVVAAPVAPASKARVQASQSGTNCADEQATIFSCTLTDGSQLRVCQVNGSAQYRFGPASGPAEMTLPQSAGREWEWVSVPYSGGGEAQARFANGPFDYIVYSRVVRTRFDSQGNEPEFTDGVMVRQNGATIANRRCDPATVSSLDVNALQSLRSPADDLFAYADEE